jgi:hypothetical protein
MTNKPEIRNPEIIAAEIVGFFKEASKFIDNKLDLPLHEQISNDPDYSLLQLLIDYEGRVSLGYCKRQSNIGYAPETQTGIEYVYRSNNDKIGWKFSPFPHTESNWTDQQIAQLLARNNITAKMLKDSLAKK